MIQLLEDIQNHNYIIREKISSLSDREIRTAHSNSMDDVISPNMRIKIEDIIWEDLVEMSGKSQVQLLYLAKEFEQESQQLSVLRKILKRWSKENQKLDEIIPEQSDNSDHLSVNGPSTNTGIYTLKEKLEGLALSEDSPMGNTVLDMAHRFLHCL